MPSVLMFDKLQLDDPVGALSVHLVNGIWGTLAVGIFAFPDTGYSFLAQLTGVLAVGAAAFPSALLIFYAIRKTMGQRRGGTARPRPRRTRHGSLSRIPVLQQSVTTPPRKFPDLLLTGPGISTGTGLDNRFPFFCDSR